MKKSLEGIFNKHQKSAKISGTVKKQVGYKQYVVTTNLGDIPVDSIIDDLKVGENVAVYNNTIQARAGRREKPTELLV